MKPQMDDVVVTATTTVKQMNAVDVILLLSVLLGLSIILLIGCELIRILRTWTGIEDENSR